MKQKIAKNNNPLDSLESLYEKFDLLKLNHWVAAMREDVNQITPDKLDLIKCHLEKWATVELSERTSKTIATRINSAKFGEIQTLDNFDFNYNKSTRSIKSEYMTLYHATLNGSLPRAVFVSTAGLGKTHLSRAIGYAACQAKTSVFFIPTAKMVNLLATAKDYHRLEQELNKYRRPRLLILDETAYVTLDMEASNLFFQVISARHDEGLGTIVTTNATFGEWNQIFAGNAIAHAVIDRLTDGASTFFLEGESYREYRNRMNKKKMK